MDFNVQIVIRGKSSKDEFFESYLAHSRFIFCSNSNTR